MNANFWDQKYAQHDFGYGQMPNVFLASQAQFLSPGQVAFVPGDGEGRNGLWLAEQGLEVSTLDLSPVAVATALEHAKGRGLRLNARAGDLAAFAYPDAQWDVVAAIWLHLPPPLRLKVHRGLWEGLRPKGLLLLEAYRPAHVDFRGEYGSCGGPPMAELMMSASTLRADFPDGDFELLEEADVVLDEGSGHQGRSATVRARIRKR